MRLGTGTGKMDSEGIEIKCGDAVSLYEFKEGYTERHAQDGWGRTVSLCKHDQHEVPDKVKTITGIVKYDEKCTGFVVEFDDYMLGSGRKSQNLYMLGKSINRPKDKLLVI